MYPKKYTSRGELCSPERLLKNSRILILILQIKNFFDFFKISLDFLLFSWYINRALSSLV